LTLMLIINVDGSPVCRQSPIQVVTTRQRADRELNSRELNSRPLDRKPNVQIRCELKRYATHGVENAHKMSEARRLQHKSSVQ